MALKPHFRGVFCFSGESGKIWIQTETQSRGILRKFMKDWFTYLFLFSFSDYIGKAGAINAAVFAVQILALNDEKIAAKLADFRKAQRQKVIEKDSAG